jgi:hypothetical protein
MAKTFVAVANFVSGSKVRHHGNRKTEKGKVYKVVRSASQTRGAVTVQHIGTGKLRALPRSTRMIPA